MDPSISFPSSFPYFNYLYYTNGHSTMFFAYQMKGTRTHNPIVNSMEDFVFKDNLFYQKELSILTIIHSTFFMWYPELV